MITRQAISVVLAVAAITNSASGFIGPPSPSTAYRSTTAAIQPLHATKNRAWHETYVIADPFKPAVAKEEVIPDSDPAAAEQQQPAAANSTEIISDIPPTPTIEGAEKTAAATAMLNSTSSTAAVAPAAPLNINAAGTAAANARAALKKSIKLKPRVAERKGGHSVGLLSPIVVLGKYVLGQDELKKVRAKVISIHSELIKDFISTADSDFGKVVLRQLFNIVDADNSLYLDKAEVEQALSMLGFNWLGEKEVNRIFKRADENGDLEISLDEFMIEAPKTLKINLIKLAKVNGDELGLLI